MANDFSGDATCVALYNLETGALTTDSKGSLTLTNTNGVTASTTFVKQGTHSALFVRSSAMTLETTDAALPATFPLKSGTSNKDIGVCAWCQFTNAAGADAFMMAITKYDYFNGKRSFAGYLDTDGSGNPQAGMTLGYNSGGSGENTPLHDSVLSFDTPYHLTWTYRDSDKAWAMRIRDTNGAVVGSDKTGTATLDINGIAVTDAPFQLGYMAPDAHYYDGYMDEAVIFNRFLTADDSTAIAKGLYGPNPASANDPVTVTEDRTMHMPISLQMMKLT